MATSELPKPSTRPPDVEPFGQAGVRQYFGKIIDCVCVAIVVCACTLWYRSVGHLDSLEWRGGNQELTIRSIAGRLRIDGATFTSKNNNNSGWLYRRRPIRVDRDGWEPSLLKTIGFEFRSVPSQPNAAGGFWVRIKWYFIVIVFLAVPVLRGLLQLRRSREEAS